MSAVTLPDILAFEWDKGNIEKNWRKHKVQPAEAEQAFFDKQRFIHEDVKHSTENEQRFILIGKTKRGRMLYIAFTKRKDKIRIISARSINKREVKLYEETIKRT